VKVRVSTLPGEETPTAVLAPVGVRDPVYRPGALTVTVAEILLIALMTVATIAVAFLIALGCYAAYGLVTT
jgi:hypothetical protein